MQIISPISHYRYLQRLFGHRYTSNVPHISCWIMSKSKIPKPSQIQVQAQEMVKFASTTMCLNITFFNGVLTSIVHLNRMKCFVSEKKQHDRHNGDTHRPIILQDCNTLHFKSYSLKGGIFLSLFTKAKSSNIIWDLWSEPQKHYWALLSRSRSISFTNIIYLSTGYDHLCAYMLYIPCL